MNRRSFFATICAAVAGAKAKVWKPLEPPSTLSLNEFSNAYLGPALKAFADKIDNDLLSGIGFQMITRDRFRASTEAHNACAAQFRADFDFICGSAPVKVFSEPSGDIPLDDECECEDWDD